MLNSLLFEDVNSIPKTIENKLKELLKFKVGVQIDNSNKHSIKGGVYFEIENGDIMNITFEVLSNPTLK